MPCAAFTKYIPGNDCHFFFFQEPSCELFRGQTRTFNTWKCIKSSQRFKTIKTKLIESIDDQAAPPVIFFYHLFHFTIAVLKCFNGTHLGGYRRAQHGILVDLCHGCYEFFASCRKPDE